MFDLSSNRYLDLHPDDHQWGHHFLDVQDGTRIHYVRKGSGQAVILCHGWPGFWYDWRRILPTLAQEADVICPDFLGFGDSDKPDIDPITFYSPNAQATRIESLIHKLKIKKAILVGYDIGARIAQTIIQHIPESISGLVLANPPYAGIGERRFRYRAQQQFWYQHFHQIPNSGKIISQSRETIRLYLGHFYTSWIGRKGTLREKEFEAIVDMYARDSAMERSFAWYQSGAGTGLFSPTTRFTDHVISHPTRILWGEKDPLFPIEWADRLSDYFTDYSFIPLADVGHFAPFEASEEMLDAIWSLLHNDNS